LYDVLDSIEKLGWSVAAYISNQPGKKVEGNLHPVCEPDAIEDEWLSLPVVFPQITPGFRLNLQLEAMALGFTKFANVVDPTAIVSQRSQLGEGVLINAGSIVASNAKIQNFCVLNRGTSVGHDSVLEDYVSFGPGAIACGSVRVGSGTFVGAGAIITPKIQIGANSIVGAGTVVTRDVPARCQVVGNPGRIVKSGILGYNDALVDL